MLSTQLELVRLLSLLQDLLTTGDLSAIEINQSTTNSLLITLLLDEGPAGTSEFAISEIAIGQLPEFLRSRLAAWTCTSINPTTPCTAPSTAPVRNKLLLAPLKGSHALCTVDFLTENDKPLIQLRDIENTKVASVLELYQSDLAQGAEIADAIHSSSGLLVANLNFKTSALDASHLILSSRPDALFFTDSEAAEKFDELLDLAVENLVVVGATSDDPVALISQLKRSCETNRSLENKLSKVLLGAWSAFMVKKTCNYCKRQTPLSDSAKKRVPECLQYLLKQNYPFGRGCNQCNSTAYNGNTILSSWFKFSSKAKLSFMEFRPDPHLYRVALEQNARPILEVGICSVLAGHTSFEEVFSLELQLPSAVVSLLAFSPAQVETSGNCENTASAAPPKILLIEDDESQRKIIETILKSVGYQVSTTENGSSALALLIKSPVDLVVCDVMMPVMSGKDFVKQLRASGNLAVPVLVLTAVHDADTECELLDAGANDYCEKSVKRKVLLKRIEKLLKLSAAST